MAMPTRPSPLFSPAMQQHSARAAHTFSAASATGTPTARNVTAIIHSPERSAMLCRYPSKLCDMLRSEKRGGGLHRFCAYHRERANINQRRVDHRRRLRKKGLPVPPLERAPSHWQTTDVMMRHSDSQRQAELDHDDGADFVKSEAHQDPDHYMPAMANADLFDAMESAPPLLPDFSDADLQELMQLLDDVDGDKTMFSIKEETVAEDDRT